MDTLFSVEGFELFKVDFTDIVKFQLTQIYVTLHNIMFVFRTEDRKRKNQLKYLRNG